MNWKCCVVCFPLKFNALFELLCLEKMPDICIFYADKHKIICHRMQQLCVMLPSAVAWLFWGGWCRQLWNLYNFWNLNAKLLHSLPDYFVCYYCSNVAYYCSKVAIYQQSYAFKRFMLLSTGLMFRPHTIYCIFNKNQNLDWCLTGSRMETKQEEKKK